MRPGAEHLVDLAARLLPRDARALSIGGAAVAPPALAARRVLLAPEHDALAMLRAHEHDPLDGVIAAWPSRVGALMPVLEAMRRALAPSGLAIVCDLVWQTAPTPELLKLYNEPGREKTRPIEGYEMQLEHSGFEIVERGAVEPRDWLPREIDDPRGAAKLAVWVLRPAPSDEEATSDEPAGEQA